MTGAISRDIARTAIISLVLATQVSADGIEREFEPLQGVSITQLCVESARKGDDPDVKLSIENWSGKTVTLTGIKSKKSKGGELYFRGAFNTSVQSESLTILQNETLNLSSSHVGVRLLGMKQDLNVGQHVPLLLEFRDGTVRVDTHALEEGSC